LSNHRPTAQLIDLRCIGALFNLKFPNAEKGPKIDEVSEQTPKEDFPTALGTSPDPLRLATYKEMKKAKPMLRQKKLSKNRHIVT
jgi:hypothetical protein